MKNRRPRIAITMGDPAGIGPEVVMKALARPEIFRRANFLVIGDTTGARFSPGVISPASGRAAIGYIDKAVKLIKAGEADALVTAPINKKAASLAGFKFPGHTEYLAYLVGARKFCMMLVACPPKPIPNPTQELRRGGGPLRVVLATRHIALKDVSRCLDQNQIRDAIILTHQALKKYFRIRHPRIAVCALNPHAGEDGMFSDEESRIITPAIKKAKVKGVVGPLPADSLFYDAYRGRFDAQIVMYHDQGLIPLKMVAKDAAVNITLGLPFIRTSPAHGTAFDIAGRNKANPSSMIEAIKLACQLVRR